MGKRVQVALAWILGTLALSALGLFLYELSGPEAWQVGGTGLRSITGFAILLGLGSLIYRAKSVASWFPLLLAVFLVTAYCVDPWYVVPFHGRMPMSVVRRWAEYGVILSNRGYVVTDDAGSTRAYQIGPGPSRPGYTPVRIEEIPEQSNVKAIYLDGSSIRTRLELWRLGYPGYSTLGPAALRIPRMYRYYDP